MAHELIFVVWMDPIFLDRMIVDIKILRRNTFSEHCQCLTLERSSCTAVTNQGCHIIERCARLQVEEKEQNRLWLFLCSDWYSHLERRAEEQVKALWEVEKLVSEGAEDWRVACGLRLAGHYPQVICKSSTRPNWAVSSLQARRILIKLSVSFRRKTFD